MIRLMSLGLILMVCTNYLSLSLVFGVAYLTNCFLFFFFPPQTACTIKRRYKNILFMQVNIPAVVFVISLQSMFAFAFPLRLSSLEDPILISVFNRNADSYHTLYCLAGLSSAQHHLYPSATRRTQLQDAWEARPGKLEAAGSVRIGITPYKR